MSSTTPPTPPRTIEDLASQPPLFVKLDTLADTLGITRDTLTRMRKRGEFPEPIQFGPRSQRWHYQEVIAWAFMSRGRRPATLRDWKNMRAEFGFGNAPASTSTPTPAP